jgi:hypothetical protein
MSTGHAGHEVEFWNVLSCSIIISDFDISHR